MSIPFARATNSFSQSRNWIALGLAAAIGLAGCGGGGGSGSVQPGVFGTGVATSQAAEQFFQLDPGIAPPILESSQPALSTDFSGTGGAGAADQAALSLARIFNVLTLASPEPQLAQRLGALQFGGSGAQNSAALTDRNGNGVFDLGDSLVRSGASGGTETIDLVGFGASNSTSSGPAALLRVTYNNFNNGAPGTLNGTVRVFYERVGTATSTTLNRLTIGNSQYTVAGGSLPTNTTGTFKVRRLGFEERASLLPLRSLELVYEGASPGIASPLFGVLLVTDAANPLAYGGSPAAFAAGGVLRALTNPTSSGLATSPQLVTTPTAPNTFTNQVIANSQNTAVVAAQAAGTVLSDLLLGNFNLQ